MKKNGIGSRIISMLLVLVMVLSALPVGSLAAKGDPYSADTGLTGNIDTSDTISLPIKILDYENDGMLFEFAESIGKKGAVDFGASAARDYTTLTTLPGNGEYYYNFWETVTPALKTGTYANYVRFTYKSAVSSKTGVAVSWNNDNRCGMIIPNDLGGVAINNARYLVLVYRSNVKSGKIEFLVETSDKDRYQTKAIAGDYDFNSLGATNWTYAVYDLKGGNGALKNNWSGNVNCIWTTLPMAASGEYIDIAHAALFANADQARAFGEYALTDGSDRGDNRAFGLLRGSRNQSDTIDFTGVSDAVNSVAQLNTYSKTEKVDYSTINGLGYKLLGLFGLNGIANIGLLESSLSNGYPVYKKDVVDYVAELLKQSLEVQKNGPDGWKNYRYVEGTASSIYGGTDLATALRTAIDDKTIENGDYEKAAAKNLIGKWADINGNISTYHDAAYFLLNAIFVPGSYNDVQDDYNYLVLSAGTDKETGDKVYVFDAGFADTATTNLNTPPAIDYNATKGTIQNTSANGKAEFYYGASTTTTLNPFLPIQSNNTEAGQTMSRYYQDDGVINRDLKVASGDTLYKRDFNFAMVSKGEFVYYADDELFFEFEGDDDVYLFINDELVMDIGSAHSIDSVRFELNDYVNAAKAGTLGSDARNKALSLVDGNTYSFKFYYMERHSYGSNIRIMTNIRVTDPSMVTEKTAWQDDVQLDFGSIVDKDKYVEYGFAITNNGDENLYNLTFEDQAIGVKLDPSNGLTIAAAKTSNVKDINGETLTASDLTALITCPGYDDINITFADNNALKKFLEDLTAAGTEAGGGLYAGAKVLIRGFGYMLTEAQVKAGVFDNTVLTTATNKTKSKTLQGQASMRVFVPADPMYYEWAGKDLEVTKDKLINDVLAAAKQEGNVLAGKVPNLSTSNVNKIELVTKAGTVITNDYVKIDSSNNLTINYPTPGSKVFYVKVTYNSSKNSVIVPVLVNVTDVKDSVFVLDYGLKANLTDGGELFKNDTLTVPGRTTNSSIIKIGSNGAYSPNEITFSDDVETKYGKFNIDGNVFSYTPDEFIEGVDEVQIALNVYESDADPSMISGTLDINNEVEMYKSVSVLPANVVYYEDCFPAITYTDSKVAAANQNTFENLDITQSVDQKEEYGHDDVYEGAETDEVSGGTLTTISITENATAAYFTFKGTGFELIGRTNATDSGILRVKVYEADKVVNGIPEKDAKPLKNIPVITEFDHDDNGGNEGIYQVPVIRVNDLPLADGNAQKYTVLISGVPYYDFDNTDADGNPTMIPTNLYIDGLRIFQPGEGDANIENNYDADEKDAQFIELRKQIVEGKVAVGSYTEDSGLELNTALHTWTEDHDGTLTSNEVETVEDYLLRGPNNEVYVTGTYDNAALIFYVKKTGDVPANLQIAFRAIDENLFFAGIEEEGKVYDDKVTVQYGIYDSETKTYGWKNLIKNMDTSTEQYYTIDLSKCPVTEKGYQVVVRVVEGMASFSSLKYSGLEFYTIDANIGNIGFINGIWYKNFEADVDPAQLEPLSDDEFVNISSIKEQLAAPYVPEEEVPETEPTEPVAPKPVKPTKPVTPFDPSDIFGGDYISRHQQIKKMLQWINSWMGR